MALLPLAITWSEFFQQLVSGLAFGGVYASLALALVLIYRTTHVLNFAQGEMAMFTTYIAWSLIENHGFSFWPAFFATIVIAFFLGAATERVVIRPFEDKSPLTVILATIALFFIFNGLAQWIWSPELKVFFGPFKPEPFTIGGVTIARQDVGVIVVTLVTVVVLWAFFRFTKVGLAMRAAAIAPVASRLMGVRVGWMYAMGWGFAASLGAVSGMMIAPIVFLTPQMMQTTLIFAFAAAVLGGIESPVGAVVGGLLIGVMTTFLARYGDNIPFVDTFPPDLVLPTAFVLLILVLLFKPAGLFGKHVVRRV
jgi:branched-chain amino acid transport system permease protein